MQGKDDGDALPRSARGRPLRPSSQRADSDSDTEDDEPPSPSVTLPRCVLAGALSSRMLSQALGDHWVGLFDLSHLSDTSM